LPITAMVGGFPFYKQCSDQSIKFCEHSDELQVYSSSHNTALCNECYFENA
jgi:hypothetical protein